MFVVTQFASLFGRAGGICFIVWFALHPVMAFGADQPMYAQESYTTATGQRIASAPILFTITIPEAARHRDPALAFVRFVLTSQDLLRQFGFGDVEHRVGGDGNEVPAELRALTSGVFKP
jgi:hypothetical protein